MCVGKLRLRFCLINLLGERCCDHRLDAQQHVPRIPGSLPLAAVANHECRFELGTYTLTEDGGCGDQ